MTGATMAAENGMSWQRAYGLACLLLVFVFFVLGAFALKNKTAHEEEEMQVVSLDVETLDAAGSGHAGGGSGAEAAFPAPLSSTEVAERRAEVQQSSALPLVPSQAEAALSAPAPAAEAALFPDPVLSSRAGGGSAGGTPAAAAGDGGSGDGADEAGVTGETGAGAGQGEGSGAGAGSGDSGAAGSGSAPFDTAGFWAAVNASKTYPFLAVKRGLEGTAGVAVTLDAGGSCASVSVTSSSGSGLLDDAVAAAARAACPYPNPTGGPVTVHVNVTFALQ